MEQFLEHSAELLEEDVVNTSDELKSFDAWDSLTILSIIAFADENYGVTLNAKEINEAQTVGGLKALIDSKVN